MNPLYSKEEYEKSKNVTKLPLVCKACSNTFYIKKHYITKLINNNSPHNTLDFCSVECAFKDKDTRTETKCALCSKVIIRTKKQIKDQKNHFCNHSCAAKHSNSHKTKGTRVSKLEKWLHLKLQLEFPTLKFSFNNISAIKGELDIYVESLQLAFELNGIFHYEPIFGDTKLAKIQNRDSIKFLTCIEQKIDLCVIDVSSLKYFKEQNAQKYLDIITAVIKQRLESFSHP